MLKIKHHRQSNRHHLQRVFRHRQHLSLQRMTCQLKNPRLRLIKRSQPPTNRHHRHEATLPTTTEVIWRD